MLTLKATGGQAVVADGEEATVADKESLPMRRTARPTFLSSKHGLRGYNLELKS